MRTRTNRHGCWLLAVALFAPFLIGGCGILYSYTVDPTDASDTTVPDAVRSAMRGKSASSSKPHKRPASAQVSPATSPATATNAPFLGNQSVITAPFGDFVVLTRQSDCSLTFGSFAVTGGGSGPFTTTPGGNIAGYEKTIHDNAFLTTTPDVFPHGCADNTAGITSGLGLFPGLGKSGQYLGAAAGASGNDFYTFTYNTAPGALSNLVSQPTDIAPFSITYGDLNKDGNPDIVSINTDGINSSITVALGNADGSYKTPVNYDLPGEVVSFGVVDDLNGDGNPDVIVNTGNNTFTIYLGKGDGTFQIPPTVFSTGAEQVAFSDTFITADVNGDSKKDIITSEGLVFLGQGNGTSYTFKGSAFPRVVTGTNELSPGIVAADFNNDSKLDLATDDGRTIRVYLGNGDGTFNAGAAYATLPNRGLISAADLDGDGNLDLISGYDGKGSYLGDDYMQNVTLPVMGNGDGTFQGAPSLPVSYSGTNLGDLNGDGHPDLVAFSLNSSNQGVLTSYITQSNGIPAAAQQLVLPAGQTGGTPVLGKFMGGTTEDVFWVGSTPIGLTFNLSVGNGDGSFQLPVTTNAPSLVPSGLDIQQDIEGVQTVDINHDGKADLVYWFFDIDGMTNTYYEGIAVQLGNGDGTFQAPKITLTYDSTTSIFDSETSSIAALYDVNKDNFPDLFLVVPGPIVMGTQQNSLALYISNGDGTFQSPTTLTLTGNILPPSSGYGSPLAFGDLDGDGNLDIVASGSSSDATTPTVAVALGNGNGTFKQAKTFTVEGFGYAGSPVLADFTGDGKLDLVLPGATEGGGGIFPGNGDGTFQSIANGDGTLSPTQQIALSVGYVSLAADFNSDGKLDLLFGNVLLLNKSGVTPPTLAPTTTVVASSLNPSTVGANVTFTATVTSTTAGTITGSVDFFDGATDIGSGTIASGVATYSTTTLTEGPHTITAQYLGDANYATSTSTAITQTVNASTKATTSTVVVSTLNPSVYGGTVGFDVTITSATAGTITGTVTVYDGATSLGTVPVQAGGVADLFSATFNVGANSITAQYSGDANYAASTSPAIVQNVTMASTATALSASSTSAAAGTNVTFTATVTTSGTSPIAGTVNFLDGGTMIGSGAVGAAGVATYSTTALAVGAHSITANYTGNADFNASTSSAVAVTITSAGTFTLSANPAAVTVTAGTPGSTTITVTPSGGFSQTVNLSCANPPAGFSCTFGPPSVTPNGGSASSTLTITDGLAPGDAARARKSVAGVWPPSNAGSGGGSGPGAGSVFGRGWLGSLAARFLGTPAGRFLGSPAGRVAMNRLYAFAFGGELLLLGIVFARRKKLSARTPRGFFFVAPPAHDGQVTKDAQDSRGALAHRPGRLAYALLAIAMLVTVMAGCAGPGPTQTTTLTINATAGAQTVTLPLTITIPK